MAEGGLNYFDAKVYERVEAEREMIREGLLVGVSPRRCPDLMRECAPEIDRRGKKDAHAGETEAVQQTVAAAAHPVAVPEPTKLAKVIPFPNKRVAADGEQMDSSDLEFLHRLQVLQMIFMVSPEELLRPVQGIWPMYGEVMETNCEAERERGISQQDLDRLLAEIEAGRKELLDVAASLRLTHTGIVRLSQELDEKIVRFMKMQKQLHNQQKPFA